MTHTQQRTRRLLLLGATGSIGRQTLEVVANLNALAQDDPSRTRFEIVGLAAGASAELLYEQARTFGVRDVALANGNGDVPAPDGVRVHRGADAAESLVRSVEADIVLGAMVGAAGLPATMTALELECDVAIANKETLVAAGELVVPVALRTGAALLPVDSEHSALWQSLPTGVRPPCALGDEVRRIILTSSGGPFRTRSRKDVYNATPEEALAHPTWSMGAKVTIDSASMTNKALEIIEAHWLFGVESARIDVLVHPQAIIHSMVEYADGATIAQLGAPDMRTPIQYALVHPERPRGVSDHLDWTALSRFDFEPPDFERFPALRLAHRAIELGGVAGAVFNGANEQAVEAFLARRIPFGRVTELAAEAMEAIVGDRRQPPLRSLDDVFEADAESRRFVAGAIGHDSPVAAGPARR
ncbi:MAG: 1-deoxy-D-xylulose-5-phosphate reductoisomerase [Phycisphaeraceae bacterium]|nr:MAG: 1-deoxy-D-xylulose-5-phosphate reductoisomerase [Phycisphaeraceae bacterium]